MTFYDFEKNISGQILDRGYHYFMNQYVDGLEKVAPGMWLAQVHGSEMYMVQVNTNRSNIKSWECNCPYEHGPICKHVVAVLYAIVEEIGTKKTGSAKKKKFTKSRVQDIFAKTSKEDLQKFITEQFKSHGGLKNALIAHFAEYLEEDSEKKYRTIVRNIYKAAQGRHGYIEYNSTHKLVRPLYDLLNKAQELAGAKNIKESLAICKTLIEEVPTFLHGMDDSDGSASDIFTSALDTLDEIACQASPLVKDELFTYLIEEFKKEKYHGYGFGDDFLYLLPGLITTSEQEEVFFKIIEERIKVIKQRPHAEFGISQLLQTKVNYLSDNGRNEEALAIIEAHKEYPGFRRMLVERAISNKEFEQAKELCQEGINFTEEKRSYGTRHQWDLILLDIAKMQKDIPEVRKQSEKLLFAGYFDLRYYNVLKSTYKKEKWTERCEQIINRIKGKNGQGSYFQADALARIFVEEKYWDRLLKLVELNSDQLQFVDQNADFLKKKYPVEILNFYEKSIKAHATQTGRNIYNEIAGYLTKMKKIKGGDKKVADIISNFRIHYNNRPAMMEILNKKFPESISNPPSQKKSQQEKRNGNNNSNLKLF